MRKLFWPVILAALGILLRIVPVWGLPTWYDENFSILLSRLPLDRLLAATAGDVHPPLWYLLCWPLAHIPGLPAWAVIRLPAVLASIATIWIWWQILQILETSNRVRLVAFGLFCFIPQQIYYAQEGRMYSLLTLLVLSAWLCILRRQWLWLAVSTALMLYLQNYGLLYAAALWLAALVYDRRTWRPLTIALAAAGLAYIPWLIVLLRQMSGIGGNYWMVRVSLPSVLAELAHSFFEIGYLQNDMVNVAVFYGVLVWVLIWEIRHRSVNLPAVILAFVPLTLAALVSVAWQPIMLFRALIPSGAFIALLIAEPVEYMKCRSQLLLAIFFIPVFMCNALGASFRMNSPDKVMVKYYSVLSMVENQWQPGDLLYYSDAGLFVTWSVYWHNIDNAILASQCGQTRGGLSPKTRAALGIRTGSLPAHLNGRVWVVTAESPLIPSCGNDYFLENNLINTQPLDCMQDDILSRSCIYLVEP
jgi:uncharacterized membrane protein